MPPREPGNGISDKILGIFGIRKPKKRAKISRRRSLDERNVNQNQNYIGDDFQFVNQGDNSSDSSIYDKNEYYDDKSYDEDYYDDYQDDYYDDDYQEENNMSKKRKKKRNRNGLAKHPILRKVLTVFLVFVITCCLILASFIFYIFTFVDGKVDQDLENLKLDYTSILYAKDSKGHNVELTRLHGDENRLWVDLEDMPEYVGQAFVSCEDKRFYIHSGVDWKRTISVTLDQVFNFYDSTQGGSTITQQLVKNLTNDKEQTYDRKIREIMRARYIEQNFSKDCILECYLNTIYLANGANGVEVASNYYFDKHVEDINIVQAACLACVTKDVSAYDPYKHPEANKERRNWVLDEMYNNGYITKAQCDKAKNAKLGLRKTPSTTLSTTKKAETDSEYNSYFVDAVIEDVINGLVEEKGYTKEYAENQIYKGGYRIYTTVDLEVQKALENVYKNDDYFAQVETSNGEDPESAMTVMDYQGHIVGVVGGRGEKKGNRVLNRATQSPRPTGSSIKPIAAYASAFEYNVITWGSSMEDSPVTKLNSGEVLDESWPKNFDSSYHGNVSILYAIQQSLNTIPVKLVQEVGIDSTYDFITKKMGVTSFEVNGPNGTTDKCESSLALGGSVRGITTVEMAAAFSTFGNGGVYYNPTTYTKILDQNNDVVIDKSSDHHRAISEGTAGVMCKLLQTVATSGTGQNAQFDDWQIMCKTGTTTDNKDRWFVGGTPYYMAATWFGTDNNGKMYHISPNPASVLWKAVMEEVHSNLEKKDFEESDKVEYRKYCKTSGMCARTGCYNVGYGYFKSSYTPFCTIHGGSELSAIDKSDSDSYYDDSYYEQDDDTTTAKTSVGTTYQEDTSGNDEGATTQAVTSVEAESTAGKTEAAEKKTEAPKQTETQKKTKR